jgi:hypothetical protein
MELAGMMAVSRKRYLFAVERLIRRYGCSPADLTEPQVHDYRLACHRRNPAKTTFKLTQYALRLFSRDTLGRDWKLFKKNEAVTPEAAAQGAPSRRVHAHHPGR